MFGGVSVTLVFVTRITGPECLADLVRQRRQDVGLSTATALAARMKVSSRIIGEIENGRRNSYRNVTLWSLDDALFWERGSAQAILNGGEPRPLPIDTSAANAEAAPASSDEGEGFEASLGAALDDLSPVEREEVLTTARLAALRAAREIREGRAESHRGERYVSRGAGSGRFAMASPTGRVSTPRLEAVYEEPPIPVFSQLVARTVTSRPVWDAANDTSEEGEGTVMAQRTAFLIADVLRILATEQGQSQISLSQRSGVSQAQISRVFSHKRSVSIEDLSLIAEALGTTASRVVREAESRLEGEDSAPASEGVEGPAQPVFSVVNGSSASSKRRASAPSLSEIESANGSRA